MRAIACIIISIAVSLLVGYNIGLRADSRVEIRTEHSTDTVLSERWDTVYVPVPKLSFLQVTDTIYINRDTTLLREDKIYTDDSTFRAHVSGIDARLDSITTWPKTKVVTIHDNTTTTEYIYRNSGASRWGVGIQVGYGIGRSGLSPYVGLGFTYKLF